MITQYHKLALVAAFGLTVAFTLSCSSGSNDNNPPPLAERAVKERICTVVVRYLPSPVFPGVDG